MDFVRKRQEELEHEILSPYACHSNTSRGREIPEPECDIRTCFQRDRDRIIHSKAFRRLNGKTQVFLTPQGDHYRTRMTHTLEVAQIARTIAKALRLNEDLTEAIALGHDLGHTPFGHAGERALNRVCSIGFAHHEQSIRVVDLLEDRNGKTMNLTWEVKDGILNHQTEGDPHTLEGRIVRFADKIAYINHDIDDAIRGNIISESDIPKEFTDVLGHSLSERLNTVIHDIVKCSFGEPYVEMTEKVAAAMKGLRSYMFESVYTNPVAKGQEKKAESLIEYMFEYYNEHNMSLPQEFIDQIREGDGKTLMEIHLYSDKELEALRTQRAVCDYIAGMTDRYAVAKFNEIMVPESWNVY